MSDLFSNMLAVKVQNIFSGDFFESLSAAITQFFYLCLTGITKVVGLFLDLLNVAFYIFAGIDINSTYNGTTNMYNIKIESTGERKNILDYFLFSESMRNAYMWLALIGLFLIVVFTIYKIIKQDYFEKAGPRSKGPIFRNVAISCISFLLVIPIFYLIIHASSLLAVVVMDAMGMDSSEFAGAKIFQLSWSDNGAAMRYINHCLSTGSPEGWGGSSSNFQWMNDLNNQVLFTLMADGKYVKYDAEIMAAINKTGETWSGSLGANGVLLPDLVTVSVAHYYWYIFFVGAIVTVKSLYLLITVMIQRIFKLMGLFVVAPSPISQYVLDDGEKYKKWLHQSIHEGFRLVVASLSFSIFLMALSLIKDIDFISAFESAKAGSSQKGSAESINVSTSLLSNNGNLISDTTLILTEASETSDNMFYSLVNAFMKIALIMGAGGAIVDLDSLLTPLITGKDSSLNAGETGKGVTSAVSAAQGIAASGISALASGAKSVAGSVSKQLGDAAARRRGKEEGQAQEQEDAEKIEGVQPGAPGGPGGGTGGPTGGSDGEGETPEGAEAPTAGEAPEGAEAPASDDNKDEASGEGAGDTSEKSSGKGDGDNSAKPAASATSGGKAAATNKSHPFLTARIARKIGDKIGDSKFGKSVSNIATNAAGLAKKVGSTVSDLAGTAKEKVSQTWAGKAAKVVSKGAKGLLNSGEAHAIGTGVKALGGLAGGAIRTAGAFAAGAGKSLGRSIASTTVGYVLGKENAKQVIGDVNNIYNKSARDEYAKNYTSHANNATTVEKAKAKAYNQARQERVQRAAAAISEYDQDVSSAITDVNDSIDAENEAKDQLDKVTLEGEPAILTATNASGNINRLVHRESAGIFTSEEVAQMNKNEKEKKRLERERAAITRQYGTVDQMKAVMDATRGVNDEKYQEYMNAYAGYNEKTAQLTQISSSSRVLDRKQSAVDIMSGKDGERAAKLEKLGVTSGMSFADAKKIVDNSGDKELKEAFGISEAQAIYENKHVTAARTANETSRAASAKIKKAKGVYDKAKKVRIDTHKGLTDKFSAYSNAVNVANTLATSITDSSQGFKIGKDAQGVKSVQKTANKARAKAEKKVKQVMGTINENVRNNINDELNDRRGEYDLSTVQGVQDCITEKQTVSQVRYNAAKDRLDEAIKTYGSAMLVDSTGAKVTLESFVRDHPNALKSSAFRKRIEDNKDTLISSGKLCSSKKDADQKAAYEKLLASVTEYDDARVEKSQVDKWADTSKKVVTVLAGNSSNYTANLNALRKVGEETLADNMAIDRIIASGGASASAEDIKVVERVLNREAAIKFSLAGAPETDIFETARQAQDVNLDRYTKVQAQADQLIREHQVNMDMLAQALYSAAVSAGQKPSANNATTNNGGNRRNSSSNRSGNNNSNVNNNITNNNSQNVNNTNNVTNFVNNNPNSNGDVATNRPQYYGSREVDSEVQSHWERMQTEGIKNIESALDQIRQTTRETLGNTETIKKDIDEK